VATKSEYSLQAQVADKEFADRIMDSKMLLRATCLSNIFLELDSAAQPSIARDIIERQEGSVSITLCRYLLYLI
jgi:hypothetical protein